MGKMLCDFPQPIQTNAKTKLEVGYGHFPNNFSSSLTANHSTLHNLQQ
jgi:hypothetical protein